MTRECCERNLIGCFPFGQALSVTDNRITSNETGKQHAKTVEVALWTLKTKKKYHIKWLVTSSRVKVNGQPYTTQHLLLGSWGDSRQEDCVERNTDRQIDTHLCSKSLWLAILRFPYRPRNYVSGFILPCVLACVPPTTFGQHLADCNVAKDVDRTRGGI